MSASGRRALRIARGAALLGLAALLCAGVAQGAEVRRIEAVGTLGLVPGQPPSVPPRDAAVRAALWDAVRRVALEILGDPQTPESEALLRDALGTDPLKYTTRFRIREDRGERPALLSSEPGVESEYVVVVDAHVDVDRVRQSLSRSGLLAMPSGDASRVRLHLAVEMADGAGGYGAYTALRQTLLGIRGVRSAQPMDLVRGRAVLLVVSDRGASALLDALMRSSPPGLTIRPIYAEAEDLGVRVEWSPPPSEPAAGRD